MPLERFHPAVRAWFEGAFATPTACQARAWPAIGAGRHALIAAPTGSGKTLAAFLFAIDTLVRESLEAPLPDETRVLYVSPLKALSNDVQRNLEQPLSEISEHLGALGEPAPAIRAMVRTGDTPAAARQAMRRCPPHILVTTPESLYILLTSEGGRNMLASVRNVIVDEIHALAGSKRGAHLALSLERLEALTGGLTRVGLSATQHPIEEIARFLTGRNDGAAPPACTIIDTGHVRARDIAIEVPDSPLEAVMSGEAWGEIFDSLRRLIDAHRTTLVFVNTRRMAERVARHLSERLGDEHVSSHHGSLSKEKRLHVEQRLKAGTLKALVATASLELGIDIGDVELVCQLGSPRAITTFLQRVGRSGHTVRATPKGRLFPLSRDELVECAALIDAVRRGELDRVRLPEQPLDVLAQQIVAMVACEEWCEDALFERIRLAYPYRALDAPTYRSVVRMLADGFSTRRGRRGAYLHRDVVHRRVRARRGARLTAITSGGAIPDNADYDVVLEPAGILVGTLNEDFAIESLAGDIFQLGNTSWRILRIEAGKVRVEDARGLPPNIPFWFGEAPGRSDELSASTGRLRCEVAARLESGPQTLNRDQRHAVAGELAPSLGMAPCAAQQLVDYLAAGHAALGALPDNDTVILERFFDESGGMQLVIHSTFGSRVNRAWGLALRKRFCRKFNFELQAAATENAIVLSLGETHSFALEDVSRYLSPVNVRDVLIQALLTAPLFTARWRWCANIALAIPRFQGGRKVPPHLQRMRAEDLVAVVFPDQIACAENLTGRREVPDHPLVAQTIDDALVEAMDIEGLERLLEHLASGAVRVVARDLTEPSPLAQEILNAKPYAFLDDAPLEERRTRAVLARRWIDPESAADIGKLDGNAIVRVQSEAWPPAENADELHDALNVLGFLTEGEAKAGGPTRTGTQGTDWNRLLALLVETGRACRLHLDEASPPLWVAIERLPELHAVHPSARAEPPLVVPEEPADRHWSREDALASIVRARLQGLGPVSASALAAAAGVSDADIAFTLAQLESEGFALRGQFTGTGTATEWCERRLLARIHRYTLKRLRRDVEPVSCADFMRFLFRWQHVSHDERLEGPAALAGIIEQLSGFESPAAAWEADILPARVADYEPAWLDQLCLSGRATWLRLTLAPAGGRGAERGAGPVRTTPIAILTRNYAGAWMSWTDSSDATTALSSGARKIVACLHRDGASFFDDLVTASGMLRTQVEDALAELAARGLVDADSFAGLRALLVPSGKRRRFGTRRRRHGPVPGVEGAGRWTALRRQPAQIAGEDRGAAVEHIARGLLRRYGVVFKRLLVRETALPPWRELLAIYRRIEARGEIRGGHFVAGIPGEHYALADAVGALRETRRRQPDGELVSVSAADPLNLVGIVTTGARLPATAASRVLYRDGRPVATSTGRDVHFLETPAPQVQWELRNALLRRQIPPAPRVYPGRMQ